MAEAGWLRSLGMAPCHAAFGIDPGSIATGPRRHPFDEAACAFVEEARPQFVSFHFGVPADDRLRRVRAMGATVMASATSVAEARRPEPRCDATIAQGVEAGGLVRTLAAEAGLAPA